MIMTATKAKQDEAEGGIGDLAGRTRQAPILMPSTVTLPLRALIRLQRLRRGRGIDDDYESCPQDGG